MMRFGSYNVFYSLFYKSLLPQRKASFSLLFSLLSLLSNKNDTLSGVISFV